MNEYNKTSGQSFDDITELSLDALPHLLGFKLNNTSVKVDGAALAIPLDKHGKSVEDLELEKASTSGMQGVSIEDMR